MICCRCFAEACCQDTISFGFVTGHLKENLGFATKRRYRPFDKWLFSSADHYVQLPRLSYKEWKTQSIQKWSKKDPKWKRIFSQIVMVSYSSLIYYSSRFVSLLLIFYVLSVVRRLFLANCLNRVVIINHPLLQATLKTHWLKMTHTLLASSLLYVISNDSTATSDFWGPQKTQNLILESRSSTERWFPGLKAHCLKIT